MSTGTGADRKAGVTLSRVSKGFMHAGDKRLVLDDVSLQIEEGEIVAIVGPSGVGKSTLLRLIIGLLSPDQGSIEVGGVAPDVARAEKFFGLMPQSPALLPWRTVLSNVSLAVEVNRQSPLPSMEPLDALRMVGLGEWAGALPAALSGGMAHRVAMARAIVAGAPILILDEPFSSVDEVTRETLYEELLKIWEARRPTVVFVTHNLNEAVLLADRAVVLGGTPATVRGEVKIVEARPRTHALDYGALSDVLSSLRSLLREPVA